MHRAVSSGYVLVAGGMASRALLQACLVILLARSLGREAYGASVAILSVTGFFSTMVGMGASILHLRDTSIHPEAWRGNLLGHLVNMSRSFLPLLAISYLLAWFIVRQRVGWSTLSCFVVGDLLGFPATDLMVRSFQGRERYALMALAMVSLPGLRLFMWLVAWIWGMPLDLDLWGYMVLLSGLILASAVFSFVRMGASRNRDTSRQRHRFFSGFGFAMTSASSRVHADADKAIIARLSTLGAAGEYSIAYRLMDVLMLPVSAAIEWSVRRLFKNGGDGVLASIRRYWGWWSSLLVVAILVCLVAFLVAPLLPAVFGGKYVASVSMARWLAALPLTTFIWMAVRSIAATTGHERLVGWVEFMGAGMSLMLGIILVMNLGWKGAVLATYFVHIGMSVLVICMMLPVLRRERAEWEDPKAISDER
jgi:O-antigen/teichoic acid export membrane protein